LNKKVVHIADNKDVQIEDWEITTKGPLGNLIKDLKKWGGLDEDDAIYNIDPANISNLGDVMTLIQEGIIEK
jgi:ribosomal protein L6P/L9E